MATLYRGRGARGRLPEVPALLPPRFLFLALPSLSRCEFSIRATDSRFSRRTIQASGEEKTDVVYLGRYVRQWSR